MMCARFVRLDQAFVLLKSTQSFWNTFASEMRIENIGEDAPSLAHGAGVAEATSMRNSVSSCQSLGRAARDIGCWRPFVTKMPMTSGNEQLTACHECDLLISKTRRKESPRCSVLYPRCGALRNVGQVLNHAKAPVGRVRHRYSRKKSAKFSDSSNRFAR